MADCQDVLWWVHQLECDKPYLYDSSPFNKADRRVLLLMTAGLPFRNTAEEIEPGLPTLCWGGGGSDFGAIYYLHTRGQLLAVMHMLTQFLIENPNNGSFVLS